MVHFWPITQITVADFVTDFVADCVTDFGIFFVFQVDGEIVWWDICLSDMWQGLQIIVTCDIAFS